MPAAERYNVASHIDAWVVSKVINFLSSYSEYLADLQWVSINLSGQSIGDEELLESIVQQLSECGNLAEKICFEVTETATIANLANAMVFIKEIKQLGCRFALDDFGSGLSSFAYLKNLPVDFLKIDGLFVKELVNDPIDRSMVTAINQVGHTMNIKTIAEYVENDATLEALKNIGIDFVQGFGIEKPKPLFETFKQQFHFD